MRGKLPRGGVKGFTTNKNQQNARIEQRLTALEYAWQNQAAALASGMAGQIPEMVLVMEIAGTMDDFFKAVGKTEGMEFLGEYDGKLDVDDEFELFDSENRLVAQTIPKRVFLSLANQAALNELRSIWQMYRDGKPLPHGKAKYKELFKVLADIRPYSVKDRLMEPGIREYLEQYAAPDALVNFEAELVYKAQEEIFNQNSLTVFEEAILEAGGQIVPGSHLVIPELHYQGLIAQAPASCFADLSENTAVSFLKSSAALAFRPVGQSISVIPHEENLPTSETDITIIPPQALDQPVAALLDGFPIANHVRLSGRLNIDDPDGFEENYLVEQRVHGTSMASLIIHGDHNVPASTIGSKLYVRPVMRVGQKDGIWVEQLPETRLFADLLIRAVKRMAEGDPETGEAPTAPNVKIINLAIGDPDRPFFYNVGIWAKVLDWLSYKCKILFIVSAGNQTSNLAIPLKKEDNTPLAVAERELALHQKIAEDRIYRRILSPGEAINAITVGALNADKSGKTEEISNVKLLSENYSLIAPYSRIGAGFDRSVKPEVLLPGGKVLGRENFATGEIRVFFPDSIRLHPPGIKSAMPGRNGLTNAEGYTVGTSNSIALATRHAIFLHQMLEDLNNNGAGSIPEEFSSVMIKALLVHGAHWQGADELYKGILRGKVTSTQVKRNIHSFLGYGKLIEEVTTFSTEQRVTMLGYGKLVKEQAHVFFIPLPEALNAIKINKRIWITLAWLSPLHFQSSKYRQAQLFVENPASLPDSQLALEQEIFDFKTTRNGTVQHLVLKGNKADVFMDGATLRLKVSCKEDAPGLNKQEIPYALAVTMEVPDESQINIYEQIKIRLQQQVRVQSGT